ncbi:unnamed protein product [Microthlaspi erraticum]|uniref:GOST seven transmembrane domain-containing protein n=1 Tax=Microthlaspi erraticum TaxID=1685480 RepID=A0A6D2IRL7_9BRAS|nr:unnamed protein product [Microthlaspi erraticum]
MLKSFGDVRFLRTLEAVILEVKDRDGKFNFLAIPLAVLDVCLILWIFVALARTDILKVRYMAQLRLFVKFTNTLA